MGRRRINQGKERRIISISLDREVLATFDQTLGENTRSRRIESLIREYLRTSQKDLTQFQRHIYHCNNCHREWHTAKLLPKILLVCGGSNGCGSDDIEYCGILGEEE